jgi:hypothetical protein
VSVNVRGVVGSHFAVACTKTSRLMLVNVEKHTNVPGSAAVHYRVNERGDSVEGRDRLTCEWLLPHGSQILPVGRCRLSEVKC